MPDEINNSLLNGWKEIAAHMGRGVRTVQRWESLGLPIRRPNGRLRSAVFARADEVDTWVSTTSIRPASNTSEDDIRELETAIVQLKGENRALRDEIKRLQAKEAPGRRTTSAGGNGVAA